MLMRETSLDTLDRAREIFTKSLIDGIGKSDAAADFFLSAVSAERNGYILSESDESLIKMFYSVLRKEEEISGQAGSYNLDEEGDVSAGKGGAFQADVGRAISAGAGMNLADNPSYNEQRVVPPMPGESLSGRQFKTVNGDADDPYRTHNYLGSYLNPLHGNMHDIVGDFYVHSDDPYAQSQSEIDAYKEAGWEDHANDNEHDFLLNQFHYGRLDTKHGTNHALYEQDYRNWTQRNQSQLDELRLRMEQDGKTDDEISHYLKKQHINQKKEEWKQNLGLMDYLFGMEWLTPEERAKAYAHMEKHGGADALQPLTFGRHDGNIDFMPRFKRNFHQRFAGLYDHWKRDPAGPGHGMEITHKPLPESAEYVEQVHNIDAMERHNTPGKQNSYARAIADFNYRYEDYARVNNLARRNFDNSQVPYIYGRTKGGAKTLDNIEWQKRVASDKKSPTGIRNNHMSYEMMKLMLGVGPDGQIYEDGEHPLWGDLWRKDDAEFSQDEVDAIMQQRSRTAKQTAAAGRMARNHGSFHYGTFIDPSVYGFNIDANGAPSNETLATYWHRPFLGGGGLGKHPNELYNLLHHHTLSYVPKKESAGRTYDEAGQVIEQEDDISDEYAEYLAGLDGGESEQEEQEMVPHFEETTLGANRKQHSLLFSRTGNAITGRHSYSGASKHSMLPFLGPFGQQDVNLFQMMDRKQLATVNPKGDSMDATANMNPWNVLYSSRIKGVSGNNAHTERHTTTVDSAFNNKVNREYHNARKTGDRDAAEKAHKSLHGEITGHLRTHNPLGAIGGSTNTEQFMNSQAHQYHYPGYMLGFANPPMSPAPSVLAHDDRRIRPTLRNPDDVHLLARRHAHPAKAELDDVLDKIDQDYQSRINLPGLTDEQKQEFEEEMQRRTDRAHSNFRTSMYPSSESLNIAPDLAGEGLLEGRLSEAQPLTEDEERYFSLIEQAQPMFDRLEDPNLSDRERDEIRQQIIPINRELDELESSLDRYAGTIYLRGASGHQNTFYDKMVADTNAIADAGVHLKNIADPETLAQIFNPNADHATVEANIRMWAKMANDYLNMAPHDAHGIHTMGTGEYSEEGFQPHTDIGRSVKQAIHRMSDPLDITLQGLASTEGGLAKGVENAIDSIMDTLGFDRGNPQLRKTATEYFENTVMPRLAQTGQHGAPVMTLGQLFKEMYPDVDLDAAVKSLSQTSGAATRDTDTMAKVNELFRSIDPRNDERNRQLGIHHHMAHSTDDRHPEGTMTTKASRFGSAKKKRQRYMDEHHNTQQKLNSIITGFPELGAAEQIVDKKRGLTRVPIDRFGPNSHSVHSLYNSAGYAHEMGGEFSPNFDYKISPNGEVSIRLMPQGNPQLLVQPLETFWNKVAPDAWLRMLRGPEHQEAREGLNTQDRIGAQFRVNSVGLTRNADKTSVGKSDIGLADLTNPDIIRKELGSKIPTLQPMHRIFELDDLEQLRGFSGDWIVSHMPDGERGFVEKKDDEVSSVLFDLSDEDKDNFKQVTDEDFHVDVIKLEDGYYIFDVVEFAGKEVHDVIISDRIKILRGGMEGIENVHVPSASDTRLADDAGLKSAVEDLQKEYETLLLRDAKSVYMAGELRHPKWVMLKPGRDVVLRVLERRGNGPYTYRLGTGPITQDEHIGNRAVESQGETYMDVGAAFNSPEKFNEGDHVRVNVANVSKVESAEDNTVYTLSGSEIVEEAEGEGLVSQETLGMLAKSLDSQWICEVHRAKSGIRVIMPQGDVVYKTTESGGIWTAHSPLASSDYLIRLSESQRPYWSPIAGALLKADVEIKEEVHESQGDAKPLIEPKKVQDAEWWNKKQKQKVLVKGLALVDKFLKSGAGAVGQSSTGTMGLGIDYATPIESPMGPTNLNDEKTMPDFDNRKRPGEDAPIEPGEDEDDDPKHVTIPTEGGELEISSDKAILRT